MSSAPRLAPLGTPPQPAAPVAGKTAAFPTVAKPALGAGAGTKVLPPAPVAPAPVVPAPVVPAPVVPAPATPAPALAEVLWAVDYPDGQDRELTLADLRRELAAGAISASSLVWRDGMDGWLELGQVPELQSLTAAPAVPPPPPPPPEVPAPRATFASEPEMDDLPTVIGVYRPAAHSAPLLDVDFPAPPPQREGTFPIPRSPTMSGIGESPVPPAAVVRDTPLPGLSLPSAPVMVPAPSLAAPFASGAPTFGRPSPMPVNATAPIAVPRELEQKSRAPLVLGVLVLLAIAAAIYFFGLKQTEEPPRPSAPISALPAEAPEAPHVGSQEPSAPPAAAPSADNPQPVSNTPRANLMTPPGAASTTPNAGFAEMFANGARRADEKQGASGPTQHFDPNVAKAALALAATEAGKCRESGGPTGTATLSITFEPSGKVASAAITDPPFAGTSSGACIVLAMKRANMPPFSGLPGTLTKTISIQ